MKHLLACLAYTFLALIPVSAQDRCWGSPEPFRFVYDEAQLFDFAAEARVQVAIEKFNAAYGVTLVIYLAPDLCGWTALGFATVLGSDWGVGDAESDNGLVLLLSPKREGRSGGIALSVGKGLEEVVSDAEAQVIIDEMIPRLKEEDWYGAVAQALNTGLPAALRN